MNIAQTVSISFKKRAHQCRLLAGLAEDPATREKLLSIADDYDMWEKNPPAALMMASRVRQPSDEYLAQGIAASCRQQGSADKKNPAGSGPAGLSLPERCTVGAVRASST